MAGIFPVIPLCYAGFAGAFLTAMLSLSTSLHAELDARTREDMQVRSRMRNFYEDMMLTEHNLSAAMEKNDFPRLVISLKFLSNLMAQGNALEHPRNICEEAGKSLLEAATFGGLFLNQSAMTVKIDKDRPFYLGASDEDLLASYSNAFIKYKETTSRCEEEVGRRETQRLLPEKLLRVK